MQRAGNHPGSCYIPPVTTNLLDVTVNRRRFLSAVGLILTACSCSAKAMLAEPDSNDVSGIVRFVHEHCRGFLRARRGRSTQALWRGGDPLGVQKPPPDLLDDNVMGQAGTRFFKFLEENPDLIGIRPSTAHIATGDKVVAGVWGTPRSIWPIGKEFYFSFWKQSNLIFPEGVLANTSDLDLRKIVQEIGPAVRNETLDHAINEGKEVIFEMNCDGFLVVDEHVTESVLKHLEDL